jgi:hypothetical protein
MLNRKIDFGWDRATSNRKREEWGKEVATMREEWLPLLAF